MSISADQAQRSKADLNLRITDGKKGFDDNFLAMMRSIRPSDLFHRWQKFFRHILALFDFHCACYFENMSIAILSVGRDPQLLNSRNRSLEAAGFTVISCTTMPQIINTVFDENFDAALLCNSIQGEDRRMLAGIIRRYYPSVPVILISDSEKLTQSDGCWMTSGNFNSIIAAVHRALRRTEAEKTSISSGAA